MRFSAIAVVVVGTLASVVVPGVADAQTTLYWGGGNANVANGTPLPTTQPGLTGTWAPATQNWATSASGATYGTWSNGAIASLGTWSTLSSAQITLSSDITLSGLISNSTLVNNSTQLIASSARVITASPGTFLVNAVRDDSNTNTNLAIQTNVSLTSGTDTLLYKTGYGLFQFNTANNAFLGTSLIDAGAIKVTNVGSLNGATAFTLRGIPTVAAATNYGSNNSATPLLQIVSSGTTAQNQLANNAVVTLGYGVFQYEGTAGATAASSESMGKIVLEGFGRLNLANSSTNTVRPTLTLTDATAGIDRGASGLGTLIVEVLSGAGVNQGLPTTDVIVSNGVAAGALLPWVTTSRAEFMQVNAGTKILERIASTAAATDLTTWDTTYSSASNVRIGGNAGAFVPTGALDASTTVNSLGIFTTTAGSSGSPTLSLGSNQLTIASGGLVYQASGAAAYINGGSITTGNASTPLYVSGGQSTGATMTIASKLTGFSDLIVSSANVVALTTASAVSNDYTGTTYINGGGVNATSVGNSVVIPGNVVIQNAGSLNLAGGTNTLAAGKNVTINGQGLLSLGGQTLSGTVRMENGLLYFANTFNALTGSGTAFVFNGGYVSHSSSSPGSLEVRTNVSYAASATMPAVFNRLTRTGSFTLALNAGANAGNAERTFDVADSTTLAGGVAEMLIDNPISNGGSGSTTGSLRKTGAGTLMLTDTSTYTGGTVIDGGVIRLATLGQGKSGLTATFGDSAEGGRLLTFAQRGTTEGLAVGQVVTGSNMQAGGRTIARVLNDYQVLLNAVGNSTNPTPALGYVATDIAVAAQLRSGSLAGAVTVNAGGMLALDGGLTAGNAITLNAGGSVGSVGSSGTSTFTGGITLGGANAKLVAATGATVEFRTGAWTTGNHALAIGTAGNAGTILLSNALATSGGVRIDAGTLRLGATGSLGATTPVNIAGGALLDVTALGAGLALGSGQVLSGVGTVAGAVTVGGGATIAPGNSPGTLTVGDMTFASGGNYNWQLFDTGLAAGTGWDLLSGTGGLSITATTESPFAINLWTLSAIGPDVSGNALGFDPAVGATWDFATFTGGISGFSADKFAVITTSTNGTGGFANPASGAFSVAQAGNTLQVVYTAVPEPSTLVGAGVAAIVVAGWSRRRARRLDRMG